MEREELLGRGHLQDGGSLAVVEAQAIRDASADLARRVVERTIEGW